ncbi:Os06g0682666 [Oryza sativa Japonica Group]|uniref:Os06g0682666 protein n=1 Tax=Oryza sativa subsp. japonica TaxID=39947 RepID=A0A0P0X006_ORYSJ|nr:hypothetical protein EE612_036103 [Oryza sativa]BAS99165.1 Os06g0682666 [Oryza sativa Japonica Group]
MAVSTEMLVLVVERWVTRLVHRRPTHHRTQRRRHHVHRPGRVRRHRRPRRDPELVPVVGVALAAEDEGVVRVVVLLVADHDLELGPVLRDVLDDLVDALLELRVGGGRGRGGGWRGVERRRVHVGGVGRRRGGRRHGVRGEVGRLLVRREVRVELLGLRGRHAARVGRVLRERRGVGRRVVRVLRRRRRRLRVEAVLRLLLLRLRVRHGRGRVVLGLPVHETAGLGGEGRGGR